MKIRLPRRCQECTSEFIIDPKDNELETKKSDKSVWITCPVCGKENLMYRPKAKYE